MAAGAYAWPAAKIGSAKGAPAAKKIPFKPITKQGYSKGGGGSGVASKHPDKRPGMSGDKRGKGSPLARKEKK